MNSRRQRLISEDPSMAYWLKVADEKFADVQDMDDEEICEIANDMRVRHEMNMDDDE